MRLKKPVLCFALFALMAAPVAAHADNMSVGPLTFGNTTLPFEAPGAMPAPVIENGVEIYKIQYFATSFGFGNGTGDTTYDMTYTSPFELAPGWSIVGMQIFDGDSFDSFRPCDNQPRHELHGLGSGVLACPEAVYGERRLFDGYRKRRAGIFTTPSP
jgi:hypothetical protein